MSHLTKVNKRMYEKGLPGHILGRIVYASGDVTWQAFFAFPCCYVQNSDVRYRRISVPYCDNLACTEEFMEI